MTVPEINAMFDLISSALFDKRKLCLRATDPIAGFILKKNESLILDFVGKSFDIDLTDEALRGVTLYECLVGHGEGRADADLLAEYVFNVDSDYYQVLANDKDYYVNFFKDMKFY